MNGADKANCIRSNPKPTFYYFPPTSIKLILVMMGLVRYIASEALSFFLLIPLYEWLISAVKQ